MKNNIYLVGFMGTGKSAVGKRLAKELKLKFLDLDSFIEQRQKRKIVDIFAKDGEPAFRKMEKQTLQEVSQEHDLAIACGGGIVLDSQNIDLMKETGSMVCLSARPEIILARVKDNTERPLLNVKDKEKRIAEILEARQQFYAKAHITIDTSELDIEQVVAEIRKRLKI